MSFANGLQNALAEEGDNSFQRPMASGGPPQWSGARDPVPANAGVNASVNGDLSVATGEAAAYFALKQTAPGAQVSVARGRYKVMAQPHIKGTKLFVTMSDLGSPTGDRFTLVVPSDANILPKLVRQGSVQGKTQVVNTATLRAEDIAEITIDGVPISEAAKKGGKMPAGLLAKFKAKKKDDDGGDDDDDDDDDMDESVDLAEFRGKGLGSVGASNKAAMLAMMRDKKAKEDAKKAKKGKKSKGKGKGKDDYEMDEDTQLDEFSGKGLGAVGASNKAAMLAMLRDKKAKEDEKKAKKKGKGKGKGKDKDSY